MMIFHLLVDYLFKPAHMYSRFHAENERMHVQEYPSKVFVDTFHLYLDRDVDTF